MLKKTSKRIEDLMEATIKAIAVKKFAGLKEGGKIILGPADISAVMTDLWEEEQSRVMMAGNHTVDEMLNFIMPGAGSGSGSGSGNGSGVAVAQPGDEA